MVLETNLENKESKKEFENLLKEDFKKRDLKENTIVKARVGEIGKKFVIIDINGKSDGVIPIEEFKITKELDGLKENSEIEVYLERLEGPNGIVVSREKARRMSSWKRMTQSFEAQKEVMGTITSRCKGGYIVNIESCLCFLPGSQIDIKPLKNSEIDGLMNVPHKFLVVKMDTVRGNLVVSRKKVLEKTKNKELKNILSKIKEGDIVEGKIKAVLEWGAFIDIQGADALLHCSDLSYSRVKKPADLLSIGETIKVKIIKIETATNRISVGVRQMFPDPYENLEKKFKVGDIVTGQVTRLVEYGAFIRIAEGLEGLCHSSEMAFSKRNANPSKILAPSQEIKVKIIEISVEKRRISLSYKATMENPWDKLLKESPVGSVVKAKVNNITDFGIFANIENTNLSALLHKNDMSFDQKEDDLKKYKKNMKFKAKIVEINKEEEKIRISVRALMPDPFDFFKDKKNGDVITVKVHSVLKNGIIVSPGNEEKIKILIKKNNLAKDIENCRPEIFNPGNKVDCMITDLEMETRKVNLSIKELEIKNEQRDIKKFGKAGSKSGAVLGDILGKVFSSKKTKDKKKK